MEPHEQREVQLLRSEGHPWDEIADMVFGGTITGDQLRKRYKRATTERVTTSAAPVTKRPRFDLGGPVRCLVIPDTQIRHGVPTDHLLWAGRFAADKGFDVIAHTGDWADNSAISTYHNALSREGERLVHDDEAVIESLKHFQAGLAGHKPKLQFMTEGNHEERRARLLQDLPALVGALPVLPFADFGWTVYPFLQPVQVQGVYFAHYFVRTAKGWAGKNPHPNARTMIMREMVSCVAGHTPGLDTYIHPTSVGLIRGLICGSYYQHDESYQGPQGNNHWHGVCVLSQMVDGFYSLSEVPMSYLKSRYGK